MFLLSVALQFLSSLWINLLLIFRKAQGGGIIENVINFMSLVSRTVELITENDHSERIAQTAVEGRAVAVPPAIVVDFFFNRIIKVFHPPAVSVIGHFFLLAKGGVGQLLRLWRDNSVLVERFTE